jgi:hypothetical protein
VVGLAPIVQAFLEADRVVQLVHLRPRPVGRFMVFGREFDKSQRVEHHCLRPCVIQPLGCFDQRQER